METQFRAPPKGADVGTSQANPSIATPEKATTVTSKGSTKSQEMLAFLENKNGGDDRAHEGSQPREIKTKEPKGTAIKGRTSRKTEEMVSFVQGSKARDDDTAKAAEPAGEPVQASPTVEGEKQADEQAKAPKEPDPIPYAAFKTRVSKLTQERDSARDEANRLRLETDTQMKAIEILDREYRALQQTLSKTTAVDPRDEQIRSYEIQKEAERFRTELQARYDREKQEAAARFQLEERAQSLASEARAAAGKYPKGAIAVREIIEIQRLNGINPQTGQPNVSAQDAAQHLYSERLKAFSEALTPKVEAPKTAVRNGTLPAPDEHLKGTRLGDMVAFIKSRRGIE